MMRVPSGLVVLGLVWLVPRALAACSSGYCYGNPRWTGVELRTVSPVPRDGAFVFEASNGEPTCLASLAPHVTISVSTDGAPVAGTLAQIEGLPDLLVWRPAALLAADAVYTVAITVENDALGPEGGDISGGPCGESPIIDEYTLMTGAATSEIPPPSPPAVETVTWPLDQDFRGVVCCPSIVPEYGDPGSCAESVHWYYEGDFDACAYLYEHTRLKFTGTGHAVDPALAPQLAYQLVVDGSVVARSRDPDLWARRNKAACARVEALHLATGSLVASAETCPSEALVATLGPHPRDAAGALGCDEGLLCGDEFGWSEACAVFDPLNPPTPTPPPPDDVLESGCPAAEIPGDSSTTGEPTPTTGEPTPTTGSGDGSGSSSSGGQDGLVDHGCACRSPAPNLQAWLLGVLPLARIRRHSSRRALSTRNHRSRCRLKRGSHDSGHVLP